MTAGAQAETIDQPEHQADATRPPRKTIAATSPAEALTRFQATYESCLKAGIRSSPEAEAARSELLRQGDRSLAVIRAVIWSANASPIFKLELIALLAEFKTPRSEGALVDVFAEPALEERFRTLALRKLSGSSSDGFVRALHSAYESEQTYPNRHLLIKAIALTTDPSATGLLIRAASNESSPSARMEAVQSLGLRLSETGAVAAVHNVVLSDADTNVRLAAVRSLANSPADSVTHALQEIAGQADLPGPIRQAAENCLKARQRK
jgi:hypothetical protein